MTTAARTAVRVIRALERGPLYEGVIPLIVGASSGETRRVLRRLATDGRVVNERGTWRLA